MNEHNDDNNVKTVKTVTNRCAYARMASSQWASTSLCSVLISLIIGNNFSINRIAWSSNSSSIKFASLVTGETNAILLFNSQDAIVSLLQWFRLF